MRVMSCRRGVLAAVVTAVVIGMAELATTARAGGAATDPFPYLNAASQTRRPVAVSPDPLQQWTWDAAVNRTQLQVYYAAATSVNATPAAAFTNVSSLTRGGGAPGAAMVTVSGAGTLLLDFGVERAAWLEFDSPDLPDEMVSSGALLMAISEYSEPAVVNAGAQHANKTMAPVKHTVPGLSYATYRLELNDQLYEGVRFGWLFVGGGASKEWHITGLRVVAQTKPQGYAGSFSSSLADLDRIWWTAVYTVRLNLMSNYFGSILMERSDRHSWTGDAHTAQAAAYVAFGDDDFILGNINRTSCPTCSNGIASYAMCWVLSLTDFYWNTGRADGLVAFADAALDKLSVAVKQYGTNPSLAFYGGDERTGSYFEDPSCAENQRAYRMLTIRTVLEFNRTVAAAGAAVPSSVRASAASMAASAVGFIQQQRAVGPKWYSTFGMHAAADAINAGFATPSEVAAMVAQSFSDPVQAVSFTPFNQFFIVDALFRANATALALAAVDGCWGGMLRLGATSFWETFSPQWEYGAMVAGPGAPPNGQNGYTSLCHPWAGGVAYLLTKHVLGLAPTEPGFAAWRLHPQGLGTTPGLTRLAGSHPNGIDVSMDLGAGIMAVSGAPRGSVGSVGVPRSRHGAPLTHVRRNGRLLWARDGKQRPVRGADGVSVADDVHHALVLVDGLDCSTGIGCVLSVSYGGDGDSHSGVDGVAEHRMPSLAPPSYAGEFLGRDDTTHGAWVGRYGASGSVLFSYGDNDTDVAKLPATVTQVLVHRRLSGPKGSIRRQAWTRAEAGVAALEAPPSFEDANSLVAAPHVGVVESSNPTACTQTLKVDVTLAPGAPPLNFTLYAADVGAMDRRMVVEVFDLETQNTVQQWQRVQDFSGGAYLTWRYSRSIRFRVSYVRAVEGVDTGVSAIFFD